MENKLIEMIWEHDKNPNRAKLANKLLSLIDEEKEKSFAEGYNQAHREAASYINSQEK